jgi:BlaI family penicillinase repressor
LLSKILNSNLTDMERLTNREEEIMRILWKLKKAFVNDIVDAFNDPKPHYNTVSTLIRKMEEKGYVQHKAYGKTHQYFPMVSVENHKSDFVQNAVSNYFENSYQNLVSFLRNKKK